MTDQRLQYVRKAIAAGRKARKGKPITDAEKAKAVREYQAGGNAIDIAAALGVYRKTLYRWCDASAPVKKAASKKAPATVKPTSRKKAAKRATRKPAAVPTSARRRMSGRR